MTVPVPVATVWRTPSSLQVGLDDDRSAVLPGAPPDAVRIVRALLRGRRLPDLAAEFPGVERRWAFHAQACLRAAGLLGSAGPRGPVALFGAGPLAESVAGLLAGEGVDLLVVEPGFTDGLDRARVSGARWNSVVRRHRRSARAQVVEAWRAEAADPPLALVCPPTVEPDRAVTGALVRASLPHLVVRCEPDRAVVGPFVLPGRTSCVRCADLHRGRRDPHWPYLLAQLCHTPGGRGRLLRQWAATNAAAQALAFLDGGLPESIDATLELGGARHELQVRAWEPDVRCGCGQPR